MPFHLQELIGGLGNQLFSVCTVYALARKYSTSFSLPVSQTVIQGMNGIQISNYILSVCEPFLQASLYSSSTHVFQGTYHLRFSQFESIPSLHSIDCSMNTIVCSGLPMKYSELQEVLPELQDMLYSQKHKHQLGKVSSDISSSRKVGVMFRTFLPEGNMGWMVTSEYYEKALKTIVSNHQSQSYEFHIYTDAPNIAKPILEMFLSSYSFSYTIIEHVGIRDNKTDVDHFFQMFDLDDYILCNSTYHYWPALVSKYSLTKMVTYPTQTRDGKSIDWFQHIVPESWIRV